MSIPTDPIEGYYAQQADTSTRDLMDKDKGLTRPPTARELVGSQIGRCRDGRGPDDSGQCGCPGGLLAARVEAALAILDRFRPPPISGCYDTALVVGEIRRALDGRQE